VQAVIWLYREARRRKVFRTGALYVVGAWLALQVADVLFPAFDIPEAAKQALVWAAVAGLPVALAFGWLFEIGPGGIRRTLPAAADAALAPQPLGRRDHLILAAFLGIAAVLVYRAVQDIRETPQEAAAPGPDEVAAGSDRLPNSIAVLPFVNISNDPDNEYFCDGISEEILNALSSARELNVIGRTSSFAFKGSDYGIDRISAVLGVGHVLQGSVRKAGNQLRISAQLLDASGRQLWTETFDRELANVFDIQAEIAQAVASTVAREVVSRPEALHHPSLEAYDHYLAGRGALHRRDTSTAMAELARAIELDPGFAEAQAEWAIARSMGFATKEELDAAAAAIDRALELRPQLLRAQAARGLWLLESSPPDVPAAEGVLRGVLAQEPNMSDALLWLAQSLRRQGRDQESFELLQRASRIDPLHPSIATNLSDALWQRGEDEEALRTLERQLQRPEPPFGVLVQLRDMHLVSGRLVELNAVAKELALHAAPQHFSLALSYALLGDLSRAEYWIERSLKDYPDWPFNRYYRALVPQWRGDAERARQRFQDGLDAAGLDIADEGGIVQGWYGALLAHSGHDAAALEVLEPLATVEIQRGSIGNDIEPRLDGWHALAWSYRQIGAEAQANRILSALRDGCRSQVGDRRVPAHSDLLHYCAENALLLGDTDDALALLERAVEAGWRDYYRRRNDPYWTALEHDPRYSALMATVKADVDRQRAEVERSDASDDFLARLDAALARRAREQAASQAATTAADDR
jgi:TolB-like protein/predicted Zn-dependent protease